MFEQDIIPAMAKNYTPRGQITPLRGYGHRPEEALSVNDGCSPSKRQRRGREDGEGLHPSPTEISPSGLWAKGYTLRGQITPLRGYGHRPEEALSVNDGCTSKREDSEEHIEFAQTQPRRGIICKRWVQPIEERTANRENNKEYIERAQAQPRRGVIYKRWVQPIEKRIAKRENNKEYIERAQAQPRRGVIYKRWVQPIEERTANRENNQEYIERAQAQPRRDIIYKRWVQPIEERAAKSEERTAKKRSPSKIEDQ